MALSLYEQLRALDNVGNQDNFFCYNTDLENGVKAQPHLGLTTSYSWQTFGNFYLLTEMKLLSYEPDWNDDYTYRYGVSTYEWNIYGGGLPTGDSPITFKGAYCDFGDDISKDFTSKTIYPGAEETLLWTGITSKAYGSFSYDDEDAPFRPARFNIFRTSTPTVGMVWEDMGDLIIKSKFLIPVGYEFNHGAILDKYKTENNHNEPFSFEYILQETGKTIDRVVIKFTYGGLVVEKTITGVAPGRHTYTIDMLEEEFSNLFNYLKQQISIRMTVYYTDGTSLPGSSSYWANNSGYPTYILLVDSGPVINFSVVDSNTASVSLSGDETTLIRHISNAKVTMNPEGKAGAGIEKFWFTHNGFTYEGYNELNFEEKVITNTFEFYATDTRGQTTKVTYQAPFVAYVPPTANFRSYRPTGEGGVNIGAYGNCWLGDFGAQTNTITVQYRFTPANMDYWTSWSTYSEIETAGNSYTAKHSLSGLNYLANYKFQARVTDLYSSVVTEIVLVGSRPVFDWSASDFSFNVPVDAKKGLTINGEQVVGREAENRILWSGRELMTADQTIELNELISQQPNGIMLIFSGATSDTSWSTHFVPKIMVQLNNGGGQTFMTPINAGVSYIGFKYLYIYDDRIVGQETNDSSGGSASAVYFNNEKFALRYVIGL